MGNRLFEHGHSRLRVRRNIRPEAIGIFVGSSAHDALTSPSMLSPASAMYAESVSISQYDARLREDVMFFGILTHERSDVISSDARVFEHRLHFGKVVLQFFRDADVALDHTEQCAIDHCC